jgi:hypothetical protein
MFPASNVSAPRSPGGFGFLAALTAPGLGDSVKWLDYEVFASGTCAFGAKWPDPRKKSR